MPDTLVAPTETFHRPASIDEELRATAEVRFLDLPPRPAAMLDGEGPPEESSFAPRLPGLYATAWTLRFALKCRGILTKVGPLEGLWWTVDGTTDLDVILAPGRDLWRWTLLIGLPNAAEPAELEAAVEAGRARLAAPYAGNLRIETLAEGRVAQVLHLGPYATERPTIERLHATIAATGLRPRGRHHELYLGDPRRSAPDRLRTIIRQPVE
ncbi:MAG: hypothetical protein C0498_12815 [Anaerolinea sp.]|nr:hypothetical protein [Anaerolinea sp.]